MTYNENRAWSDRFIPEIKRIIGPRLLMVTPDHIDRTQAADLMVFTAQNVTIAARVRRHGFFEQYPHDFTLRSRYDSGVETEMSKICDGWGSWMLYGHANESETELRAWMLIDLAAFRAHMIRRNSFKLRWGEKPNGDGTHFCWFDIRSFPEYPRLILASHGLLRAVAA
jgi:hypothetical protein